MIAKPPPQDNRPIVYPKRIANVRSGPGTSFSIVRKAQPGKPLRWVNLKSGWYQLVNDDEHGECWIHESVVWTQWEKQARDSAPLRVSNWQWSRSESGGYVIAEGQVTNVSDRPVDRVMAVITFVTSAGEFITSDSGLIEYDPLLPNQTSPWKIMARWNPAMNGARLEFKTMFGGKIECAEN